MLLVVLISGEDSSSAWSASQCTTNWINLKCRKPVIDEGDKSLSSHTEKAEIFCICRGVVV